MDIIEQLFGAVELSDKAVISDSCYGTENRDSITVSFQAYEDSDEEHKFDVYGGFKENGSLAYIGVCTTDLPNYNWGAELLGEVFIDSGYIGLFSNKRFEETRGVTGAKKEWYDENVLHQEQYPHQDETGECMLIPLQGVPDGRYPVWGTRNEDGSVESFVIYFTIPTDEDDFSIEMTLSPEEEIDDVLKEYKEFKHSDEINDLKKTISDFLSVGFLEIMEKIFYRDYYEKLNFSYDWLKFSEEAWNIYDEAIPEFKKKFKVEDSFFECDEYGECDADDFREDMFNEFCERMMEVLYPEANEKCIEWMPGVEVPFIYEMREIIKRVNSKEELEKIYDEYARIPS